MLSAVTLAMRALMKRAGQAAGNELVHVAASHAARRWGDDSIAARVLSNAHVAIHHHTAAIPAEHYSVGQCEAAASADMREHNYGAALRWMDMGIARGSIACLMLKGDCYRDGTGVAADMRAAAQCFIDASAQGDLTTAPVRLNEIAAVYASDSSPWHNMQAAHALYELVAGCANPEAAAAARLHLAFLGPPGRISQSEPAGPRMLPPQQHE